MYLFDQKTRRRILFWNSERFCCQKQQKGKMMNIVVCSYEEAAGIHPTQAQDEQGVEKHDAHHQKLDACAFNLVITPGTCFEGCL
jgi:hypothetical protein